MISGLGVFIDVFPLDGWCRSSVARLVQRVLLKGLLDVMRVKHMVLGRRRKGLRNVVLALAKVLLAWLPVRWVARALEKVAKLGPFDTGRRAGVICWGYQESIPVTAYGEPGMLEFEGARYRVPRDTRHRAEHPLWRLHGVAASRATGDPPPVRGLRALSARRGPTSTAPTPG